MKAFETAIRKALKKIDYANPKLRQRIYQSARDALGKSQAQQGVSGGDPASTQNRRLEELIEGIEAEYRQEDLPPAPSPERRNPDPQPGQARSPIRADPPPIRTGPQSSEAGRSEKVRWSDAAPTPLEADLRAERIAPPEPRPEAGKKPGRRDAGKKKVDPDLLGADKASAKDKANGERKKEEKMRRRPVFSLILVASLVIAFVGIGIFWVVYNGLFMSPEQRDTSIPNPPATVDGGDFAGSPSAEGSFSGEWIEIFTADDISRVARRGGAKAALVESSGRPALQIVSPDPGTESEVLFELSPDILQSLAGRKSLVAMTLRASSDTPTQIYVKCMLPAQDSCGRHRFDVNYEIGDVVFSLDLSGQFAGGEPGYLALNSDVTGTGHGVDLYAIRIRPQ